VIASLLSAPPAYLVVAILAIGGACLSTAMIVYLFTRWYYVDRLTVALYFEQFGRALYDARICDEVWRRIEEEDARETEAVWVH
jgi:ABC-type transporter Mla maintaining outer membrane lipid asymmetry permease subunit MlaE